MTSYRPASQAAGHDGDAYRQVERFEAARQSDDAEGMARAESALRERGWSCGYRLPGETTDPVVSR